MTPRRPLTHPATLLATVLATLLAAVLALAGCAAPTPGAGPAPAPVAVPGPVSPEQLAGVTLRVGDQKGISLQLLLQASGQLDGLPYKIGWSTFTAGPPMLEAVNAGAIDFGQVGNTPPIFSAAAGGQIGMVGALRSTVGDAVLVPKDSPVRSLADLRGKSIAVTKGSSANGTLLNALTAAGLKPTDVTIRYLQPGDAYAAFSQGGVAAWVVWEPYVTQAGQELGARELVPGIDSLNGTGPAGGTSLSNGLTFLVGNRGALGDAARNAAIQDLVSRVGRANQWAKAHPDAWAPLYGRATGVPAAVAAAAAVRLALDPILIDDQVVAAEQKLADALTEAGLIPGKVDIDAYLDRRYNGVVTPIAQANR